MLSGKPDMYSRYKLRTMKYSITSNITLFIQPNPLVQLLSGSNRKKLATYYKLRSILYEYNIP